jgi:signal transduction histidine kinase
VNEFLSVFEPFLKHGVGPGIHIKFDLAANLPICLVGPALFEAAVLNVVTNARDAMPGGGEVQIITERWVQSTATPNPPGPGVYVRVRIKDHGHGMRPEVLRSVFDPFFTTKGEKGTGIGLPQVHAFTKMVGGHVTIASEPGIGTTVDLLFPSVEPEGAVDGSRSRPTFEGQPGHRRR